MRLDIYYWLKVYGYKLVFLGGFAVALIWIIRNAAKGKYYMGREALLLITIGFTGPLIFGQLFYVHDYYSLASIVFVVCGVAMIIATNSLSKELLANKLIGILALIAAVNISIFSYKYLEKLTHVAYPDKLSYDIALYLNGKVAPDDVVVVVGLDWNSTIPYYSERYALMIPTWIPVFKSVISDPSNFIGEHKIGAIVQCDGYGWNLKSTESESLFKAINGEITKFGFCNVKVVGK
jgi:hypothetical protein